MPTAGQVHWHEGLFLQPHHLQAMQRDLVDSLAAERRLGWPFSYGVIDAKLSPDALENMQIRFDRLRAIMPSGAEVCVPDNADLPALDIKKAYAATSGAFTVRLAVPLYQPARANTLDRTVNGEIAEAVRIKRIFRVTESQRVDENTGDNPQPMLLRRLNARLVLDGDDTSDMEVLPLLRVAHSTDDEAGLPRQDPAFAPPCLVMSGSPLLRTLARDLANQVEASRKELVIKLTQGGFSIENLRGLQFEQMLRLRTLNRFSVRLPQLVGSASGSGGAASALLGALSPFRVYLEMRELLAELAALYPDRDPFDAPSFDHDNPAPSFQELDKRIRQLLRGAVQKRYLEAKFARDGAMMTATLTDEQLTQPNEYFLGISTKMDPIAVAKLVEDADKFKLMPKSMARLNIFGVKLADERHPPLELPSRSGLLYFRLVRSESQKMWDRIAQEKSVAVRWPELETFEFTDMTLYMTVP